MNDISESNHIRIIRIATCPTLSAGSTLEYHVGCRGDLDPGGHAVFFRIYANSGGGLFNPEWIALEAIKAAVSSLPPDAPFRVSVLFGLYEGKSVNSPSFLAAILKAEGLIAAAGEGEERRYHLANVPDAEAWWAGIQALISAGTNLIPVPIEANQRHRTLRTGQAMDPAALTDPSDPVVRVDAPRIRPGRKLKSELKGVAGSATDANA